MNITDGESFGLATAFAKDSLEKTLETFSTVFAGQTEAQNNFLNNQARNTQTLSDSFSRATAQAAGAKPFSLSDNFPLVLIAVAAIAGVVLIRK